MQNLNPPVFRNIFTHRTKTKYVHFIPWTLPLEQNSNFKKFNFQW